jgi:hypothetical protein
MRFHFLSHKFARLVLPWMILVTFAATAALPSGSVRSSLLTGDGLFFLLALVDRFVPKGIFIKRLTSPARTFLAMNMAALAAILVFFVPSGRLWNPTRVSVHRDSTA